MTKTLRIEIAQYRDQRTISQGAMPARESQVAAILADPAKTASEKGIAQADLDFSHGVGALLDTARTAAVRDREWLSRCGLPAMLHLTRRAITRQGDVAIGSLMLFREDGRAYLKWDTITRDSFAGVDDGKYAEYDGKVEADVLVDDSLTQSIKEMRRLVRKQLREVGA